MLPAVQSAINASDCAAIPENATVIKQLTDAGHLGHQLSDNR